MSETKSLPVDALKAELSAVRSNLMDAVDVGRYMKHNYALIADKDLDKLGLYHGDDVADDGRERAVMEQQVAKAGAEAADRDAAERHSPSARRKARKMGHGDIFSDFGKEHDATIVQDVQVGDVVLHHFHLKRFCNSDVDVRRFQGAMEDRSRFTKLLTDVHQRWRPNYDSEMAELSQRHNPAKRASGPRPPLRCSSAASALRDLQLQVAPKPAAKKKGMNNLFGDKPEKAKKGGLNDDRIEYASESEAMIFQFLEFVLHNFNSLEEVFQIFDTNRSGSMSYTEFSTALVTWNYKAGDHKALFRKLDFTNSGAVESKDFLELKPYLKQGIHSGKIRPRGRPDSADFPDGGASTPPQEDGHSVQLELSMAPSRRCCPDLGEESDASPKSTPVRRKVLNSQQLPEPVLTSRISLLLFRNAEPHHSGEVVLLRQTPKTLADLLAACSKGLAPFIAPAEALLDGNLRPVRSVDELQPHVAYLLKGKESLAPPLGFLHARAPEGGSTLILNDVRNSCRSEDGARWHGSEPSLKMHSLNVTGGSSVFGASLASRGSLLIDRAGSPPWSSLAHLSSKAPWRPRREPGSKWSPTPRVAATLSWAGHGQAPYHHRYETWPLVSHSLSTRP